MLILSKNRKFDFAYWIIFISVNTGAEIAKKISLELTYNERM
jgi:hypothetical protein